MPPRKTKPGPKVGDTLVIGLTILKVWDDGRITVEMPNGNRETFPLDRADVRAIEADKILVPKVWDNPGR
ncbi:hypothetical protein ACLI1C_12125 [Devosia sp. XGJD_8]|uniref:hypothetical protein n=1 Tax=Devosia sp. XGJD_8 TaxID=3391187 RepID=UPI003985006C